MGIGFGWLVHSHVCSRLHAAGEGWAMPTTGFIGGTGMSHPSLLLQKRLLLILPDSRAIFVLESA